MKCKCPLCKGSGMVNPQTVKNADQKRKIAKTMRHKGFSIRAIQKALGYKSTSAVVFLLNT